TEAENASKAAEHDNNKSEEEPKRQETKSEKEDSADKFISDTDANTSDQIVEKDVASNEKSIN
ncbi:MAG: hypothetical protein J6X92_03065, partial [Bacteroidales bacterium]|nr:hypothetical protein [Bacteroidales bacterium]